MANEAVSYLVITFAWLERSVRRGPQGCVCRCVSVGDSPAGLATRKVEVLYRVAYETVGHLVSTPPCGLSSSQKQTQRHLLGWLAELASLIGVELNPIKKLQFATILFAFDGR